MGIALAPKNGFSRSGWIEIDASIALLWTVLSAIIAAWHLRARRLSANLWTLIALHLPLLLAAAWVDAALARWLLPILNPAARMNPMWSLISSYADFDLVSYAAVVAVVEALIVRRALADRQRQTMRLEHSLTRARLDYLEAQLQPHFLFNSLGAVSELAYDAPPTAALVLQQLSAVFRTALAQRADEVTLGEELIALEPYLDIQRVRFADWLTIEYDIGDSAVDCLVPRFVLQPLVENAIRHGLAGRSAAGTIRIRATVENDDARAARVRRRRGARPRGATRPRDRSRQRARAACDPLRRDDRLRFSTDSEAESRRKFACPARVGRRRAPMAPMRDDRASDSEPGAPSSPRIPRILTHPAARLALVWSVCAGIWIQQSYIYLLVRHRLDQTHGGRSSRFDTDERAPLGAAHAAGVARRAAISGAAAARVVLRVLALAAAGLVVTVVHIELLRLLTRQSAPLWSLDFPVEPDRRPRHLRRARRDRTSRRSARVAARARGRHVGARATSSRSPTTGPPNCDAFRRCSCSRSTASPRRCGTTRPPRSDSSRDSPTTCVSRSSARIRRASRTTAAAPRRGGGRAARQRRLRTGTHTEA